MIRRSVSSNNGIAENDSRELSHDRRKKGQNSFDRAWRFREGRARLTPMSRGTGYFATSALFHYLGPSFAVLLFARVDVLGVAWLRIAAAAAVFAVWRRPWRVLNRVVVSLVVVLAVMNVCFYEAID